MHPMNHPAFVQFLTYFNGNQDFFECHEVLEDYWKEIAKKERTHPLVGYIQLATGLYHWRRGNTRGTKTLLKRSYAILQNARATSFAEKIELDALLLQMEQAQMAIEEGENYQPFKINITDDELKTYVQNSIDTLPATNVDYLLHKHRLRDRAEVLEARHVALEKRRR